MNFSLFYRKQVLVYLYIAVLAMMSCASVHAESRFQNGLLWKIEYPGIASSYLFGTVHIDDPRVTNLPAEVSQAFDGCKTLTLETNPDPGAMVSMAQHMIYQDGRTLERALGKDLFQRTAQELEKQGIPPQMATILKPWAAMITLIAPKPKTGIYLDYALYLKGIEQNKTFYSLETLDEQLSVFTDLTERDQVSLLQETLDQLPSQPKTFERMTQAYIARDLGKLEALSGEQMPANPRLSQRLTKRLISDRNLRMYKRAQQQLKQGKAFIAVGALHLPGDQGLLQLLVNHGYRVSPVY